MTPSRTSRPAIPAILGVSVAACLLVAGCKLGPDYQRPPVFATNALPARFAGAPTNSVDWKPAQPAANLPRGAWWQVYGDAGLDRLEDLANVHNQELAVALARFDEARASVNVARAAFLPRANVGASYIRQRTSFNADQNGHSAEAAYTYNTFALPLQAGWEPDLWGRVRRQVESARAQLKASADDLEALKLGIQAEIAIDYFTLRATDTEYELLLRTADTYRKSLELTVNRRRGGIATDLDVSQAETQLKVTEADLPLLALQRQKLVHALAALCGESASTFVLTVDTSALPPAPVAPVPLPSELLERRPDIAAAEQRMAAANAQIGVAQTAFYPRVRFDGLAGFQSVDSSTWFSWPSRVWAFGPSLDLPIFTGGQNRAELAFAEASYRETLASYRQTVLAAFQEVEDRLASQNLLKAKLDAEVEALKAAQRTLKIATNRYKAGLVTYLEVAIAQSAALNLERTVVDLRSLKLSATVSLIRSLGGGWVAGNGLP